METLNSKEQELVAIGASIASNCLPCITYHIEVARKTGITDEQIVEAIALAKKIKEVPSDVQVKIIRMLGGRKDRIAQSAFLEQIKTSKNKNVRFASYRALGMLDGASNTKILVEALATDQKDEVDVILDVLKQRSSDQINQTGAFRFNKFSTAGQIGIINLFAERRSTISSPRLAPPNCNVSSSTSSRPPTATTAIDNMIPDSTPASRPWNWHSACKRPCPASWTCRMRTRRHCNSMELTTRRPGTSDEAACLLADSQKQACGTFRFPTNRTAGTSTET